jgi:hypothetical protein
VKKAHPNYIDSEARHVHATKTRTPHCTSINTDTKGDLFLVEEVQYARNVYKRVVVDLEHKVEFCVCTEVPVGFVTVSVCGWGEGGVNRKGRNERGAATGTS